VILLAIDLVVMVLCVGVVATSTWALICNSRTHTDLLRFLESIRNRPFSAPMLLKAFQKVTYRQHHRARMMFRDPWALYDPEVREALVNPVAEFPVVNAAGHLVIHGDGQASYGEETKH
jgi:hypothetical protein